MRIGRLAIYPIALGLIVSGVTGSLGSVDRSASAQGAAEWKRVVNLSAPQPAGSLVPTSVAVDSRGGSVAVWVDESSSVLMAAFRPRGKAWRDPVVVPGSRGAGDGKVAYAADGEAVFAWMTERAVRAVRRSPRGKWETPVTVWRSRTSIELAPPNSVKLVVNRRGRAAVLFGSRAGLLVAIGFADGTWGRPQNLTRPPATRRLAVDAARRGPTSSSGFIGFVMDRWGRVTVVWREGIWFAGRIITAFKDPGEPWSAPQALTSDKVVSRMPEIAVRGNGEVAVVWDFARSNTTGFRIARKSRNGGWVRTKALVNGMEWSKLRMAMDGSGTVTVAGLNGRGALWRTDHVMGEGWERMVRVMPPGTAGDEYALVANEAGHVMIGSSALPDVRPVWALRRSPAGAWASHPSTVSEGRGQVRGPAVAIGPEGTGVLLWAFRPAGSAHGRIQVARFVPR